MNLRVVPKVFVGWGEVHHTSALGTMTIGEIFAYYPAQCRYCVALVGSEYWTIDMYRTQRDPETGHLEIGEHWVFQDEESAVMAATLIYGQEKEG